MGYVDISVSMGYSIILEGSNGVFRQTRGSNGEFSYTRVSNGVFSHSRAFQRGYLVVLGGSNEADTLGFPMGYLVILQELKGYLDI